MADWRLAVVSLLLYVTPDVFSDASVCQQMVRCNQCIILASERCAWCSDEEFERGVSRCDSYENLVAKNCGNITDPPNELVMFRNDDVYGGGLGKDPIHLKPQHIRMKLRPGKPESVGITFRVAENLPIDLYFVLDFSVTMRDQIDTIATFTDDLIKDLTKYTTNVFIGFGSFLDKQAMPYKILTPKRIENPCIDKSEPCAPSYGFIHRRQLSADADAFVKAIKVSNTSGNFDPMEGGLDAVLQAAVCSNEIGWRNNSRRVMVYISDSGFHFAGDGKLAGINLPNDGACHLNRDDNGEWRYTEGLNQDYPSMSQLSEVLKKHNINTFFVVKELVRKMYEGLKAEVGQAEVELYSEDSSQILKKITDYNKQLSQTVTLDFNNLPSFVKYNLSSACALGRVPTETNTCDSLEIGQSVIFNLTLTATECPKEKNATFTFSLQPAGLQEYLNIDLELICDCGCPRYPDRDQELCSQGNGTYECGVCLCNEGRGGEKCQCQEDEEGVIDNEKYQNLCIDNSTRVDFDVPPVCNGRGVCACGQCVRCNGKFTGKYCECDSRRCLKSGIGTAELCGGPDQGECICEKCECKNDYTGDHCDCAPDSQCMFEDKLCNGVGDCVCGQCTGCRPGYTGAHCETCLGCDKECPPCAYSKCVECLHKLRESDPVSLCDPICPKYRNDAVKKFNASDSPCAVNIDEHCQKNYLVRCEDEDGEWIEKLYIAKDARCVYPARAVYIATPLIVGIIGVGLLLLVIWRILTTFYDKIEYARFERETKNPKWAATDNPIYNSPVTTNQNPMYSGNAD